MEKIFTFCDNHRDDWDYDDSIIDPSILLTDEDYDLLATDDEFTVHDQSALLEVRDGYRSEIRCVQKWS